MTYRNVNESTHICIEIIEIIWRIEMFVQIYVWCKMSVDVYECYELFVDVYYVWCRHFLPDYELFLECVTMLLIVVGMKVSRMYKKLVWNIPWIYVKLLWNIGVKYSRIYLNLVWNIPGYR